MSAGDRKPLALPELSVNFRQPARVPSLNRGVISSVITAYTTQAANRPLLNILMRSSVIRFLMRENKLNLYYRKKENLQTGAS